MQATSQRQAPRWSMPKTSLVRNAIPVVVSVGLLSLAFPPTNLFLLVFVALSPWLMRLAASTPKQAFRSGLFFGWLFWMVQMWWLVPFVGRWTGSWALGATPWILAPLIGMWYFGLAGWLIQRAYGHGIGWAAPIAWAGVEVLRSFFPALAFPWGLLATPLHVVPPLIQFAKVGTIFGVSMIVAFANWLVAEVFSSHERGPDPGTKLNPRMVVAGMVLAIMASLLPMSKFGPVPVGSKMTVTVGQPGVDLVFGDRNTRDHDLFTACSSLFASAAMHGSSFLVLPEGVAKAGAAMPPDTPFGSSPPLPVLFGGTRTVRGATYQSAFAYDGRWSAIDKTRLVIFGEYVPFRHQIPFLKAFKFAQGDLTPGKTVSAISISGMKVGPMLCFEGLFPDIAWKQIDNGARMLAVLSNDDWYMGSYAPEQLMSASIWRAVESGVPVVRSASTGYSIAVDSRGTVQARAPLRDLSALRVELTIPQEPETFAVRKVFPGLLLLATGLLGVFPWLRAAWKRLVAGVSG